MINVIIGANAIGKTVHLENILKKLEKTDTVTNMKKTILLKRKIDNEKVDILSMLLPYNFIINESSLGITDNIDLGNEFFDFLSDMCSTAKYFIYDEPDRKVKEKFRGDVYDVIGRLGGSFEKCWITSHYSGVTALSNAIFYRAIDKYTLEKVSMEDAIEILDSI